jgi:hypothetical protein
MIRHIPLPLLLISGIALVSCDRTRLTPTAPSPPEALIGRFMLTLTAGADCAAIPDAAKTRRYLASIDATGDGQYVVTLSDATFLTGPICTAGSTRFAGVGCHQFFASRQDDVVQFDLANNNDEAHGGHIMEQLSLGTWLEIIGNGTGRLHASTIVATGTASLWYCPSARSYPFPCFDFVSCRSSDLQLTFTRR